MLLYFHAIVKHFSLFSFCYTIEDFYSQPNHSVFAMKQAYEVKENIPIISSPMLKLLYSQKSCE